MAKQAEAVWLICPYCGVRQMHYLERDRGPQVVLCDCENYPGCDRYFAVRLRMIPKLEYYSMNETDESPDYTEERMAEALEDIRRHGIPSPLEKEG